MGSRRRRLSVFRELGLDGSSPSTAPPARRSKPSMSVRINSEPDVLIVDRFEDDTAPGLGSRAPTPSDTSRRLAPSPPPSSMAPQAPDRTSLVRRLVAATLLLVALVPLFYSSFSPASPVPIQGVSGGVIPDSARARGGVDFEKRDDSPTDVCTRWAQQSAIVNGTLYLYGGQATTQPGQTDNTWNNNFLTLDLTKSWNIASPSFSGLAQPSGPPPVSLGYLWNSHDSLFLYGGEFSWKPAVSPPAYSTWEYDIASQSWNQFSNPVTSSGQSSPSDNDPVQRAAEGAGANVPSLGRGFYFGGHLDGYTTQDWSQSVARVYLQSLLEYTFPGSPNDQVDALGNGQLAGDGGQYRNITQGGLQSSAGFTERADGILAYVPGFGADGILLALAGGTNQTFTQMNVIDVYDIANSAWYRQSTSGPTPNIRVNPCAVVAAAPDGSSYNLYMFGGQNLLPYGQQTQYNDMWILTMPSFTWIQVSQDGQSVPYGRSGATCNIWDGQMIMVGGYVGAELSCDSPGVYVYDLSNLEWIQNFTSLGVTSGQSAADNPFNQQSAQTFNSKSAGGLEGSYGYTVPDAVVSVVGGDGSGGATVTTPVVEVTAGPLKTGKPQTYSLTASGTQIAGSTATGNSGDAAGGGGGSEPRHKGSPNVAAIVVGVVAGILFVIACYMAFCAYVYRKQLQLWKNHAEMAQRQARAEKTPGSHAGLLATDRHHAAAPSINGEAGGGEGSSNGYGASRTGASWSESSSKRTGYHQAQSESRRSSVEDLLLDHEPSFVGVMLNPRRSLKVINRD